MKEGKERINSEGEKWGVKSIANDRFTRLSEEAMHSRYPRNRALLLLRCFPPFPFSLPLCIRVPNTPIPFIQLA